MTSGMMMWTIMNLHTEHISLFAVCKGDPDTFFDMKVSLRKKEKPLRDRIIIPTKTYDSFIVFYPFLVQKLQLYRGVQ